MTQSIRFSAVTDDDFQDVFALFKRVLQKGDAYIYPEDLTEEDAKKIWCDSGCCVVAKKNGVFIGCYVIRPNKAGRGSHICNAAFMVHEDARGQKIGYALGKEALKHARELGYHAMQFNIVVSTNKAAVALWKKLGFHIIATVPEAFDHKELGLVDSYIMYQKL